MKLSPREHLDEICAQLLIRSPFYSSLFRTCRIKIDNKMEYPACVLIKNTMQMNINLNILDGFPLETQAGIIEHEFQHIIRGHISQAMDESYKNFDHSNKMGNNMIFNIAADAEINTHIKAIRDDKRSGRVASLKIKEKADELNKKLKDKKVTEEVHAAELEELRKTGGFIFPELFGMEPGSSWAEYYARLLEKGDLVQQTTYMSGDMMEGKGKDGEGKAPGKGQGQGDGPIQVANHDYFKDSIENKELLDEIVYKHLKKAKNLSQGHIPGEVGEYMNEVEKKRALPWAVLLKRFVQALLSTQKHSNWKKINRRFPGQLPGYKKEPKLKILIGLDASGSVGNDEWADFVNEMYAIHAQGVELWVAEFDTRITNYYKFNGMHKPRSTSGGTCFLDVHKKCIEERFGALIMFTDGWGTYADKKDVTYQSMWVLNSDYDIPYGFKVLLPNAKKKGW